MVRPATLSVAVLALALSLGACAQGPTTTPDKGVSETVPRELYPTMPAHPPSSTGDAMDTSCNADAARGAIGKTATAAVVEQARKDAGAAMVRTLKPGQMVTMEYRGDRLNIDVDERNVVTNVRCG